MRAAIAMLSHKVRSCDCRVEGGVGWCALMCWPFDSELHSMESLVKHLCMAVRVSWSGSDGFVYWRSGFVLTHLLVCIQYRSDNVALLPNLASTNRNGIRLIYATVNQSSRHPLQPQDNQVARSIRPRNKIARSQQTNDKIVYSCPLVWRLSISRRSYSISATRLPY